LVTAFSAREQEQPPDPDAFRHAAERILALPFPAYLLDSFFFLRAWNSHMTAMDGPLDANGQATNVLRGPILAAAGPNEAEEPDHRLWRWLSDFWYSTAELCGSIPYKRILKEFMAIPSFEEKWRRMPLGRNQWQTWSFNTPYHYRNNSVGDFSVFPSKVVMPPTYHLRVYVPVDERAQSRLASTRERPVAVTVHPEIHWSSRLVRTI
jgi:hypothetical protein